MRKEVRIAGFGGQGVILAGIIIGKAASLFDEKNAVQTQSYGPEARGGASRTEIVISDEEIHYPKVQNPDILVAMSHEALIKYMGDLKDKGILIIDPDMIDESEITEFVEKHKIKLFRAKATQTAQKDIGLKIVANIVMIGAITNITGIVSYDAAKQAILDTVPKGTEDKNINAFELGYAMDG
ncbi:NADH-dependent phenylglyoxylate dehydrogenase subunit gamma [Methanobrevibacter cuticularis]|uniref:NADH-dependent phenylglyoxylate dehydrogenase subunit gamma n=1 Tax=Methanobrevibacter cuticularis TaxID=47311 RepID=A0A166CX78_9EURY|nr:2-oxoacid:ferredoxin oxidoreductase subunit gamma [Methanobrevibacter cuticularis]KZX14960.1 NADH-dependent phenylglyoxylate dehydrogenase subunit gamma [Methanobrevibacter cuticularis]